MGSNQCLPRSNLCRPVAELADVPVLETGVLGREGSTPSWPTKQTDQQRHRVDGAACKRDGLITCQLADILC